AKIYSEKLQSYLTFPELVAAVPTGVLFGASPKQADPLARAQALQTVTHLLKLGNRRANGNAELSNPAHQISSGGNSAHVPKRAKKQAPIFTTCMARLVEGRVTTRVQIGLLAVTDTTGTLENSSAAGGGPLQQGQKYFLFSCDYLDKAAREKRQADTAAPLPFEAVVEDTEFTVMQETRTGQSALLVKNPMQRQVLLALFIPQQVLAHFLQLVRAHSFGGGKISFAESKQVLEEETTADQLDDLLSLWTREYVADQVMPATQAQRCVILPSEKQTELLRKQIISTAGERGRDANTVFVAEDDDDVSRMQPNRGHKLMKAE
ncbi:unnamed protein product, partial [Amoebophrya sp. A120]